MDYFKDDGLKTSSKNHKRAIIFILPIALFVLILFCIFYINNNIFHKFNYNINNIETSIDSHPQNIFKETETMYISEEVDEDSAKNINNTDIDNNIDNARKLVSTLSNLNIYDDKIDTLVFAGDIFIADKNKIAYDEGGVNRILGKGYQKIVKDADFFMANLECCITNYDEKYKKTFNFKASPSYIKLLKDINVDLVTVANNHSLDYGVVGFLDTLNNLDKAGISYVGGGRNYKEAIKPYILNINNRKYGIISATSVVPSVKWFAEDDRAGLNSGYYEYSVVSQINSIKNEVDKIIVFMHWGNEKDLVSNEKQQKLAHRFVDCGANLVIGCHSHTLQEIEYYNDTPIIYSLGNFIFGSTWTDTMLLSATFDYTNENDIVLKIATHVGVSGYEQTKLLSTKEKRIQYILDNILPISPTCSIDDENYIIKKEDE